MGKVLIVGSSGYLGAHLVRFWTGQGVPVRAVDSRDDLTRPLGVEFVQADASLPRIANAVMDDVDLVVNAAGRGSLHRPGPDLWQSNAVLPAVLGRAAVTAGVRHMVHVSSAAVYGHPGLKVAYEGRSPAPFEAYGRSMLAGEGSLRMATDGTDTTVAILRPGFTVSGGRLGVLSALFALVAESRAVPVPGGGGKPMQVLHADDLVSAVTRVAAGHEGTYAVGASEFAPAFRDDLRALFTHAGSRSKVLDVPAGLVRAAMGTLWRLRLSHVGPWYYGTWGEPVVLNCTGLTSLGWKPEHSNASALASAWDGYLSSGRYLNLGTSVTDRESVSVNRRAMEEKALSWVRRALPRY